VGISRGGIKAEPASLLDVKLKPDDRRLPVSTNHGGNFLEAVKNQVDPVANIEDAVHGDIISHVSDIAVRAGRPIVWDPIKERIIDDPQAARRTTRAWREPWNL
jgi:hypothetical protein